MKELLEAEKERQPDITEVIEAERQKVEAITRITEEVGWWLIWVLVDVCSTTSPNFQLSIPHLQRLLNSQQSIGNNMLF